MLTSALGRYSPVHLVTGQYLRGRVPRPAVVAERPDAQRTPAPLGVPLTAVLVPLRRP